MTTLAQNRRIHALRRDIPGLDEASYRALLAREFRVQSSRELDAAGGDRLIAALAARQNGKMPAPVWHRETGGAAGKARPARAAMGGPFAKVLQALWIAGWNLGLVRDRTDAALLTFVTRQTGIENTRFLIAAQDSAKAVEALKAWLARDGGVVWPKGDAPLARKRAVAEAIARRIMTHDPARCALIAATEYEMFMSLARAFNSATPPDSYTSREWDRFAEALGESLRALPAMHVEKQPRQRGRHAA